MKIRKYPDAVLTTSAEMVEDFNDISELVDGMIETMNSAKGLGLAAPQVRVSKRVIVVSYGNNPLVLVNPVITEIKGKILTAPEGCLSLPKLQVPVKRSHWVIVRAHDRYGEPITVNAHGLVARVIQHEVDHLEGVLLLDYVPEIKRRTYANMRGDLKSAA